MGCDIHGYIEYTNDGGGGWSNFGEQFSRRDYNMFGILAGVRGEGGPYEPKGIPDNLSFNAFMAWTLYVCDAEADGSGICSKEEALKWLARGQSSLFDGTEDNPVRITHPDWHTPSWLTASELEDCLTLYRQKFGMVPAFYDAVLAAMQTLESHKYRVRFTFWFDN